MGQLVMKQIAVVGLGLMGCSIIVSFLRAGYDVVGVAPIPDEATTGQLRIREQLHLCQEMGLLHQDIEYYESRLLISDDYADLKYSQLVVECVIEVFDIKKQVYNRIEEVVEKTAIIATNTSAIPISQLQKFLQHPERFMGIHWAEPAFATRFLEITCGESTDLALAEGVSQEAEKWEKEPTLLYKDIRGFITNRLMYAVYRQGFELINEEYVSMSGLDKCFQYDIGSWITLMGIFKRMDYIGLDHYRKSYAHIFPKLSNSPSVPQQMKHIAAIQGRGIHNLKGLYPHTDESAKKLEHRLVSFNKEIYSLAERYRNKLKNINL